jgi:hypothetical protein
VGRLDRLREETLCSRIPFATFVPDSATPAGDATNIGRSSHFGEKCGRGSIMISARAAIEACGIGIEGSSCLRDRPTAAPPTSYASASRTPNIEESTPRARSSGSTRTSPPPARVGGVLEAIDADRLTEPRPDHEAAIWLLDDQSGQSVIVTGFPDGERATFWLESGSRKARPPRDCLLLCRGDDLNMTGIIAADPCRSRGRGGASNFLRALQGHHSSAA